VRPEVRTPISPSLSCQLAKRASKPVQARVTGGGGAPDLLDTGTIALMPRGWPTGASLVEVALEEAPTLPLLLLWSTGARTPFVDKLRLLAHLRRDLEPQPRGDPAELAVVAAHVDLHGEPIDWIEGDVATPPAMVEEDILRILSERLPELCGHRLR